MRSVKFQIRTVCAMIVVVACIDYNLVAAANNQQQQQQSSVRSLVRRSEDMHRQMVHNHLSRKVFDRACAASKDTVDEIVACITENEALVKAVKPDITGRCHKEAFGVEFDQKDMTKHKDMICNNRSKFEDMTTCIYRKMAESLDPKEMDKLAEAVVDVGLCIINALDG